ncbi:(Fe-S)-binding protein [Euzebya sp.]|uniref:(Fe-S)-binding protein n=1 Tax=Euzebya sp. TaxID=1971409 RepID=UPI003511DA9B
MTAIDPSACDPAASIFDADQLAQCVQCGFCLSSCPTYEETHLEEHGPRGRILAMRLVAAGEVELTDPAVADSLQTCIQCRACEAVCPSLVEYGSLIETARTELTRREPPTGLRGLAHRVGFWVLARPAWLRAAVTGLSLAQLLRLDRVLGSRLRPARRVTLASLWQRIADRPLALLRAIPELELIEPDDEQRCCGSGGIYSMEQPEFGDALLAAKDAAIGRAGADGVVSGNAGCAMQIARAGWEIHHPAELLARALRD